MRWSPGAGLARMKALPPATERVQEAGCPCNSMAQAATGVGMAGLAANALGDDSGAPWGANGCHRWRSAGVVIGSWALTRIWPGEVRIATGGW